MDGRGSGQFREALHSALIDPRMSSQALESLLGRASVEAAFLADSFKFC